ncbi:cellulose synthase/poly-beta-1,6-N-acetylglucosamine synthase-like glycosyltransferase [Pedobacter africanus]|uniref:Cellulose synthase/poly-beta-1,6-N-acetylglucosamine synthase-like glycosyltransferase n=1 Tax=Pedobacter africanus TaxID=151894 RepID=A0ACC6KTQ6_9SPHI|nr:glycosyltransferase [Pedobacter africanus]MDR6782491.1 cellulose synthase/poly-beta-1,6-N-acetylglucosamine synthase-like glycosyltransferase [Pedobacter africanus]
MNGVLYSFIFIQVLVGLHFLMPLIFYVLKLLSNRTRMTHEEAIEADYAVIITAYQQVSLVPMVVDSILKASYNNYLIYVVADNCDVSELKFDDERIIVLRPESVLASNTKSHFYAIDRFKREHKYLTIIDSDNLVHEAYFNELNKTFAAGYVAVQGVRKAKNLDTTYACLDEAGDIFYRFIDRKLMFEAGSSAALSGSGMAFTTELYKQCLEHNQFKGAGFDKILQYEILSAGHRIAFSEKAVVYDEKTAKTDQLVNQRARWINTWFRYLFLGARLLGKSLVKLNRNQLLFSIMLLRPPLFMLLMLACLFAMVDLVLMPYMVFYWLVSLVVFFATVFIALAYFKADERIYKSLKNAPRFIYFQILALLKVKKANQLSVATQHYHKEKINEQTNEK